jgi:hypothetical protein
VSAKLCLVSDVLVAGGTKVKKRGKDSANFDVPTSVRPRQSRSHLRMNSVTVDRVSNLLCEVEESGGRQ